MRFSYFPSILALIIVIIVIACTPIAEAAPSATADDKGSSEIDWVAFNEEFQDFNNKAFGIFADVLKEMFGDILDAVADVDEDCVYNLMEQAQSIAPAALDLFNEKAKILFEDVYTQYPTLSQIDKKILGQN